MPVTMEYSTGEKTPMILMEMFTTVLSWAATTLDIKIDNKYYKEILGFLTVDMCCLVPSFLLQDACRNSRRGGMSQPTRQPSLSSSTNIAQNLAIPLQFSKSEILDAPKRILENFTDSFMHLLDSRMRNVQRAYQEQSPDIQSKASTLGILKNRSFIKPTTVVTSFRVLTDNDNFLHTIEYVSLPMLFEATIDLDIGGEEKISSSFTIPGTITVGLLMEKPTEEFQHSLTNQIKNVEINLETTILLESMINQARLATKKAFEVALDAGKVISPPTSMKLKKSKSAEDSLTNDHDSSGNISLPPPGKSADTPSSPSKRQRIVSFMLDRDPKINEQKEEKSEHFPLTHKNSSDSQEDYTQDTLDAASGLALLHKDTTCSNL